MTAPFRHVALIGLGLIAGSIAHALRAQPQPPRITGWARSAEGRAEGARTDDGRAPSTWRRGARPSLSRSAG